MARVKGAMMTRKRRNKTLKLAKGYYGGKSKLFRTAKEAVMKSGNYAYIGRKQKKRDFRRIWITRISAACKQNGMNYSTPEDALRNRHFRPRRIHRSHRAGEGCAEVSVGDLLTKDFASVQECGGVAPDGLSGALFVLQWVQNL